MSNIDERIVQMEFDNSLFDKNVESSIKTLEKLNVALKMDGIDKNLADISSSVNKMDFSKVESSLDSIQSKFSALSLMKMTWVQDLARGIEKQFMGVIGYLPSKVKGLFKEAESLVISGGKERAGNIAKAKFQIEGLGKDWQALYQDIDKAVTGTAYGFDEAALVASQLSASGVEAGETMEHNLTAVAGLAAMTSSSYGEIGHIMTTVQAQGKLTAMQLEQFSVRGINVLAELAKQEGKTEEELRKMVSKGEIKAGAFFDAMYKAYGEHAHAADKTFEGAMANMKAAFKRIGQDFWTPLMENAIPVFNRVKKIVSSFKSLLTDRGVYDSFSKLTKAFSNFALKILGTGDEVKLPGFLTGLVDGVKHVLDFLTGVIDSVANITKPIFGTFEKMSDEATEAVNKVTAPLEEIDALIDRIWKGEFGNGEPRFKAIDELYGIEGAGKAVQNRLNELAGCDYRYADAADLTALTTEKAGEAMEETAQKIDSVAETKNKFISTMQTIGHAIASVFDEKFFIAGWNWMIKANNAVKSAASIFGNFVGSVFLGAINGIIGVGKTIASVFATVTGALFDGITNLGLWLNKVNAFEKLQNFFEKFGNTVYDIFAFLGNWAITGFKATVSAFSSLGTIIANAGGKVGEFFSSLKETKGYKRLSVAFMGVKKSIGSLNEKAMARVTEFFEGFKNLKIKLPKLDIKGLAEKAGEALGKLGDKIVKARASVRSFFEDAKANKNNPLNRLYTYFSGLTAQGILDSAVSKLTKAKNAVKKFFTETGIAAKAQTVFSNAVARVSETAPVVFEGLLNFLGKIGNAIAGAKDKIVEFWNSFKETKGYEILRTSVVDAFNKLLDLADKAGVKVSEFFTNVFGKAENFKMPEINVDAISQGVSNAIEWIKGKFEELKAAVGGIFNGDGGIGGKALDAITSFFTNADLSSGIETISTKLSAAKEAITGFFSTISGLIFGVDVSASTLDDMSEPIANIAETANSVNETVTTAEAGLTSFFSIFNNDGSVLESGSALETFLGILTNVKNGTSSAWKVIGPIVQGVGVFKMTSGIGKAFKGLGQMFENFGGIGVEFSLTAAKIREGVGIVSKATAREFNSKAVKNVAIAIGILAASFFALGHLSWDQFKVAAAAIGVLTAALVILMGAFRLFFGGFNGMQLSPLDEFKKIMADFGTKMSKAISKFGTAAIILAFVAAIKILVGAIKEIGELDDETLFKGIAVITVLGIVITAATSIMSHFSSKFGKSIGSAIIMLALVASIKLLAGSVEELGSMSTRKLAKGIIAVVILGAVIKSMIKVTKDLKKVKAGPIIALAAVIGVTAFALYKLTELDTGKLLGASFSLGLVIAAMAGLTYALSKMQTSNIAGSLVAMIGVGALLAEIAWILNEFTSNPDLDADKMLKVSESLSLLTAVMGGMAYLTQGMGMTGMAGVSASFFGAVDIGVFTATLSAIFALVGLGSGALYDYIGPEFAQKVIDGLDWIGQIFEKVGEMFGKLAGGFIGGLIGSTLSGFTSALPDLATNLNTFVSSLGDLAGDNAPSFAGVQAIIDTVGTIASAAKENIVADALTFIFSGGEETSSLAHLGEGLIEFAGYMKEYGEKIKGLDIFSVISTSFAIDTVMAFANAVPPSGGLYDVLVGSQDLAKFGQQLIPFALSMRAYSAIIGSFGGIDEDAVEASTNAGTMLAELNKAIPAEGGLMQLIMGNKDLGKFGEQLPKLGQGIVDFLAAITAEGVNLDTGVTEQATAVAGILAEFAKTSIEPTGGVLQWLMGTKDIGVFGGQASAFGTGIAQFAKAISEEGVTFDTTLTENATGVASLLAVLGKEVAPSGGMLQWLMGEQNLGTFGDQLPQFGAGLKGFADELEGFQFENVTDVTSAITGLLDILGILGAYGIDQKMSSFYVDQGQFSSAMTAIGDAIVTFHDSITGEANTKALEEIKTSAEELGKNISQALIDGITNGINSPGEKGKGEGTSAISRIISSLFSDTSNVTKDVSSAVESAGIGKAIFDAIQTDVTNLTDLVLDMTPIITAATEGIETGEEAFKGSGETLASALASGISGSRYSVSNAGYYTALSGASGARGAYRAFYNAGAYIAEGMAAGISSRISVVVSEASHMAQSASSAASKELRINSPSKVFMKIGASVTEGFAKGIHDTTYMSNEASEDMATLAVGSAEETLRHTTDEMFKSATASIAAAYAYINEVASQSLDSTPVITPVLDMTNLQNGMYSMGNLWNMNLNNPFAYANSMFPGSYQYANTMRANNDFVTQTELRGIRSDIKQLGEAITNMNMVLDSGTLVGQLTPGIDRSLGSITGMKERFA